MASGKKIVQLGCSLVVGAVLLYSGLTKIDQTYGFYESILNYRLAGPHLAMWLAICLPWLELLVGLSLVSGMARRGGLLLSIGLFLLFLVAIATAMARGLQITCGCMGDEGAIGWLSLGRAALLLILSLVSFVLNADHKQKSEAQNGAKSDTERTASSLEGRLLSIDVKRSPHAVLLLLALIFWNLVLARPAVAQERPSTSATETPVASLEDLEKSYSKILEAHSNDEDMKLFQKRVEAIDLVTKDIMTNFEGMRTQSLDNLLDATLDGDKPVAKATDTPKPLGASELMAQYGVVFGEQLPLPSVNENEKQVLIAYYTAKISAAGKYIAERGQSGTASASGESGEVLGLCLVLPFLNVPDKAWQPEHIDGLPRWMREPAAISSLERFALHVGRPYSAYQFSLQRQPAKPTTLPAGGLAPYFRDTAEKLLLEKDYTAAVACYRAALELTDPKNEAEVYNGLLFRLADLYSSLSHPQLAAQAVNPLLAVPAPEVSGKALILRLKYLYEAELYAELLADAGRYKDDPRFAPYSPQVLYIGWVASRKLPKGKSTESQWRSEFLKKYPDHILGADMYFSEAMDRLASGEYAEAGKILDFIVYQYPDSKVVAKAKEVRSRLADHIAKTAK